MNGIETLVVVNLIDNEEYTKKSIPFIKSDYFEDQKNKVLFELIYEFYEKYNKLPTRASLLIDVDNTNNLSEDTVQEIKQILTGVECEKVEVKWLVDTTEKWCKDRAIYNALLESIKIADGQDKNRTPDSIPSILSDALSVSFDQNIGHDYFNNYSERFDFYNKTEEKVEFDLEYFNKITKGGLPNKTLNIALAGTGVGKSLFMCHVASSVLLQGRNVLYITMEMAEEKIAERIDANLLNVNVQDIERLPRQIYESKINSLIKKTKGKLIIKEYPTASAHVGHFKSLLNDLAMKKNFFPDIIFIDYLNICASSRYKGSIVNSYTYVKAIAEELRGLAVECNVPIVSATQTTRSGYSNTDVDLTDTSESFGLPATADFMFALISTEELESLNQIMVKQLKNRYNDPTMNKRFLVGIDRAKMRLYDVEQSAQTGIVDSGQEEYEYEESSRNSKFKNFSELKY
jgi:replicative DNA helicase